ncbi:MAG: cytochrome c oxidase accessory protein CcoG [Bdellovibrionales bacterium]|nr:cytochrome c oxidase accessory protein CcoG [Bdellovibrionales bacterium]
MSSKNSLDLPEDRLGMLDETGRRKFIYPAKVVGFFRNWRTRFYWVLILILLILPWIRINNHQAILLNLPERRFAFFGITFWAHDGPIIFLFLLLTVASFAFVTAVWGRIWCGWACPQTVFIDAIYRQIETWIEGNAIERRKLDDGPWNTHKIMKRSFKWFAYAVVSLIITHSVLAYFVGSSELSEMMLQPPTEHWTAFLIAWVTAAIIFINFGWFREQFCIIACPYGRLQSVLMDNHSIAVLYDEERGEPRKSKDVPKDQQGDCVNCYRCVTVCPTGIDIRRGVQLECIACTACIDACDEIMAKVNKPSGLIRYASEAELAHEPRRMFRPRLALYLIFLSIALIGLVKVVSSRESLDLSILRATDSPYTLLPIKDTDPEPLISNHFKLHFHNLEIADARVQIMLDEVDEKNAIELISPINPVRVKAGETNRSHLFFKFPMRLTKDTGEMKVKVVFFFRTKNETVPYVKEFTLVGPREN